MCSSRIKNTPKAVRTACFQVSAACGTHLAFIELLPSIAPFSSRQFYRTLCLMVDIVEVNDIEELAQYRMLWNSLFPGTPNATFFHTFDWLDTYWRHFGQDQKLRVLIVYSGGEALGILPLCVRTETSRLNNIRVLTYPLDDWSTR